MRREEVFNGVRNKLKPSLNVPTHTHPEPPLTVLGAQSSPWVTLSLEMLPRFLRVLTSDPSSCLNSFKFKGKYLLGTCSLPGIELLFEDKVTHGTVPAFEELTVYSWIQK